MFIKEFCVSVGTFDSECLSTAENSDSFLMDSIKLKPFGQQRFENVMEILTENLTERFEMLSSNCPICYGIILKDESVAAHPHATYSGRHKFHKKCLGTWMKESSTCPICRSRIFLPS